MVTGGAGYIGSHTVVALLDEGHQIAIVDDYSNSSETVIQQIIGISRCPVQVYTGDVTDPNFLNEVFLSFDPEAVFHFAGKKSIAESLIKPDFYHNQNVEGTENLLRAMNASGCGTMIFSSSATVYGKPEILPISETHELNPTNPYGETKKLSETLIKNWVTYGLNLEFNRSAVLLRYFNPVGAHFSGKIGENPKGKPNNLFPLIGQVASGGRPYLEVYGDNYDTPDGTGVRDYIHICDLAEGHIAALNYAIRKNGVGVFNLGTGIGYSVKEIVKTFEVATGHHIPLKITERRSGDVSICYADVKKAKDILKWRANRDLYQMCEDGWRWQKSPALCN